MSITAVKRIHALLSVLSLAAFTFLAGNVYAVATGDRIIYEGQGAGEVVFDGTVHAEQGLTCSDCHEGHGLSLALFTMDRKFNLVTMRNMEGGRSCGSCHPVSMANTINCSKCHHKS